MPEDKKDNQIVPFADVSNYLALEGDGSKVLEIIQDTLGGRAITPFDLERIRIPAGGATTWEVDDLDQGTIAIKQLKGIVIHNAPARSYWKMGLDEGGASQPPDCASFDLVTGIGDPGGDCGVCPFNEFGSDTKGGRGKACNEIRFVFMLRPDSYIPAVVQIPPSSLKGINSYFLRLAGRAVPPAVVVTNLELERVSQGGSGLPYSRVVPKMAGRLSDDDIAKVGNIMGQLKPMFQQAATEMSRRANTPGQYVNDEADDQDDAN